MISKTNFSYTHILLVFIFTFVFYSCSANDPEAIDSENKLAIKGADISFLPEVKQSGVALYNQNNQAEDMLLTLKNSEVNVIRLRL
jgi:arabinogalactan endo-1,4-beta-galactosidase